MESIRFTIALDESLVAQARELGINVPDAAREGVATAVRRALAEADRAAYRREAEQPDPFWADAGTWTES